MLAGMCLLVVAGCELQEVTVVDIEDVLVAEVFANIAPDPGDNEIVALVHRTLQPGVTYDDLATTSITVTRSDGFSVELSLQAYDRCVSAAVGDPGLCFAAEGAAVGDIGPGDLLEVEVAFEDGRLLVGATRIPGAFDLEGVPPFCRLGPDELMTIRWSAADGAWAYLNETSMRNLPDALAREGIEFNTHPLYLLGLSISDDDTSIVFPSEFGVFNRFDLDQDVAVRLQRGMPALSDAEVAITAVDRNFVNWARGGNFNPSGQVRVPSLRGDGTGVFGSTVGRSFDLVVTSPTPSLEDCPLG